MEGLQGTKDFFGQNPGGTDQTGIICLDIFSLIFPIFAEDMECG